MTHCSRTESRKTRCPPSCYFGYSAESVPHWPQSNLLPDRTTRGCDVAHSRRGRRVLICTETDVVGSIAAVFPGCIRRNGHLSVYKKHRDLALRTVDCIATESGSSSYRRSGRGEAPMPGLRQMTIRGVRFARWRNLTCLRRTLPLTWSLIRKPVNARPARNSIARQSKRLTRNAFATDAGVISGC